MPIKKTTTKKEGAPQKKAAVAPNASGPATENAAPVSRKRKIEHAHAYVNASYNNTVISITDTKGNMLAWASAGSMGFSGPKKATPFASSKVVAILSEKVKPLGVSTLDIFVKGVGGGRDSALRSFVGQGFTVNSIKDVTPIPHNGPRPKKIRRV